MTNKEQLNELIPTYAFNKSEMDSYKKQVDADNKAIKEIMAENNLAEASGGGYVKRILLVTASAYDVNVARCVEYGGDTCCEYAVAEAKELVNGYSAHLQPRQQSGNLLCGIFPFCDTDENVKHLVSCKLFVIKHF